MRVLLVSTYELGHQPLHLAVPAARLRGEGHDVRAVDLAIDPWDDDAFVWADAVAFSVPMHTAMRLAVAGATRLRSMRPELPICFYGLYAPVARDRTLGTVADRLLAGEYETGLAHWVADLAAGVDRADAGAGEPLLALGRDASQPGAPLPARDLLPALDRYARLTVDGETRLAGYVEASHGCAHKCRHCPVPVVYDGRLRVVNEEAVLADVAQLVAAGARHLTLGDPDFLNSPPHAQRVVQAIHGAFPELTFDITVKVEHVLDHADVWPGIGAAGCLFAVSAFETVDDATLVRLDKGHTAADMAKAVTMLRAASIEPRPSWMPFTPWTTPADVVALLDFVADNDLVASTDPVQYTIRLLLPDGSLLLDHPDLAPHLGAYDSELLGWKWDAADPAADALQRRFAAIVERESARETPAYEIYALLRDAAGAPTVELGADDDRRPRLTESWFCCAEPTTAMRV